MEDDGLLPVQTLRYGHAPRIGTRCGLSGDTYIDGCPRNGDHHIRDRGERGIAGGQFDGERIGRIADEQVGKMIGGHIARPRPGDPHG